MQNFSHDLILGRFLPTEGIPMTREDIEIAFKVSNGRITSPGKFEGEAVYVPYFWHIFLDGGADESLGGKLIFHVTEGDRKMFPELGAKRKRVALYERDDGFVCQV